MLIAPSTYAFLLMEDKHCFICLEKEYKYTCPACGTKTCSAECVKRHKLRSECTGQVDPTKFVARKDISSDPSLVNRDYNYLLNFERKIGLGVSDVKQNAKMMFRRQLGNPNKRQRLGKEDTDPRLVRVNKRYNSPHYALKRDNVMVVHLPSGMSRSIQNKSGYDKKAGTYTWTVEWVPVGTDGKPLKSFTSFRVKEETVLRDAVPHLAFASSMGVEPGTIEADKLHFSLENIISTKSRSVIPLNAEESIATVLANKVVLEFPKIYISTSANTLEEYAENEKLAYGIESDLDSSSDLSYDSSSDLSSSSDSDSSDSDSDSDDAPEETSSKVPNLEDAPLPTTETKPPIEIVPPKTEEYQEEEGFSA